MKNSGNSVQPQEKIVTNEVVLVRRSNVCKTAVDCVNMIITILGSNDSAQ